MNEIKNYLKKLIAAVLLLIFKFRDNSYGGHKLKKNIVLSNQEKTALESLKKNGYFIVQNFYSEKQCKNLVKEIDNILKKGHPKIFVDDQKSDHRINGMEHLSKDGSLFLNHPFLENISVALSDKSKLYKFLMAACMKHKDGNLGSGAGWHRDSLGFQFKAMLYLSDVDDKSGPFQYFTSSHKTFYKLKNYFINLSYGFKDIVRYSEKKVNKLDRKGLNTFVAKRGTLILFNSSGLHRGSPIQAGTRYAVTNYYSNLPWSKYWDDQLITEKDI